MSRCSHLLHLHVKMSFFFFFFFLKKKKIPCQDFLKTPQVVPRKSKQKPTMLSFEEVARSESGFSKVLTTNVGEAPWFVVL